MVMCQKGSRNKSGYSRSVAHLTRPQKQGRGRQPSPKSLKITLLTYLSANFYVVICMIVSWSRLTHRILNRLNIETSPEGLDS